MEWRLENGMAYGRRRRWVEKAMTMTGEPLAREIEALPAPIREHPLDREDHCPFEDRVPEALRTLVGELGRAPLIQRTERIE